ncbi:DUF4355 domain-containing protein [Ruminococcus sp.]|uniref:capsid assembly scaffolding protein Gp46 family protein n=1 Tax=Ruminococcus sp. TaxID=41978 RepID=UPI001B55D7E6|nr:DUF4355 domain-containing protein [Ruminococcus sp.]MBP5432330.1 DUF4355 domain-containing protein [Ruminococcus sp.]
MSEEFKIIETQEAFDAAIKARLERNTRSVTEEVTKKYEGWISPEELKKSTDQIDTLSKEIEANKATIADLTAKNAAYEINSVKLKVAREVGLPIELADRLNGSNEEELKKDAETLAQFAAKPSHQPRPKSTESRAGLTGVEEEFYKRNPDLRP